MLWAPYALVMAVIETAYPGSPGRLVGVAPNVRGHHHRVMNRYSLPKLRIVTLVAASVFATSLASWTTSDADAAGVALQRVASGLHQPVYVTSPHDGSGRLFVVE